MVDNAGTFELLYANNLTTGSLTPSGPEGPLFGPDALTPLGGYPGNDDEGRAMQSQLDRDKVTEDFVAAATFPLDTALGTAEDTISAVLAQLLNTAGNRVRRAAVGEPPAPLCDRPIGFRW